MQLVLCLRTWKKEEGVRDRHVQDSKTENADKTNFLASTRLECPDECCRNA